MPLPKKRPHTLGTVFLLAVLAVVGCRQKPEVYPPPTPRPCGRPVAVPVAISYSGQLKVDKDPVQVHYNNCEYPDWTSDYEFTIAFKSQDPDSSGKPRKHLEGICDPGTKHCKTKDLPNADHQGKHKYAVVAVVNGHLAVLDPEVNVDP